jgi:hypothetical protein
VAGLAIPLRIVTMGDADLSRFLQTMIRGTGNALAGPRSLGEGVPNPSPPTTPRDILATTSAPGLAPPRAQAGGTAPAARPPRLAEHACGRDYDAYGERGDAGKQ